MPTTAELKTYATAQANAYGIPPDIFANLIGAESSWNPNAHGAAGEEGIAQLMPGTAPGIDRFDPFASLAKAAQLLRQYYDKFGSWPLAVAAYNAGPNNASIAQGNVPLASQGYVSKIMSGFGGSGRGEIGMQGSVKIIFWAAAAVLGIVVLGAVAKP